MEFGLFDTDGIQIDEMMRSKHSNHVQPGQGEGLVLRDLEVFTPDLLDTEESAIHQTVAFSVEHSPLKTVFSVRKFILISPK